MGEACGNVNFAEQIDLLEDIGAYGILASPVNILIITILVFLIFILGFFINRLMHLAVNTAEFEAIKADVEGMISKLRTAVKKDTNPWQNLKKKLIVLKLLLKNIVKISKR